MTLVELARLVAEMREAQRQFFATRDGEWLRKSKRLEKRVDAAVEECAIQDTPQRRLF